MIVDCFAGVGGWEYGLKSLTDEQCVGIEDDLDVCTTRRRCGLPTISRDVSTFTAEEITAFEMSGLIASPPCPSFSKAGRRTGVSDIDSLKRHAARCGRKGVWEEPEIKWNDPLSSLSLEPMRWILGGAPMWFAVEQVRELAEVWAVCAKLLERHGWSCWSGVLDAAHYGVPQRRYRAFLIGHSERPVYRPSPTHRSNIGDWVEIPEHWMLHPGTAARRVKMRATNQQAPTIAFGRESNAWFWTEGPNKVRELTETEALALQTLPPMDLAGNKHHRFRQIANAVPAKMAEAVLRQVVGGSGT